MLYTLGMRKNGRATREKILASANQLIFESGYGGTTVDEVIDKSGITKGAFFYHFKSKEDLAQALVERYAAEDMQSLDAAIEFAKKSSADPVQQLLTVVNYFIDLLEKDPHPEGCLYASYCYESGLLREETLRPIQNAVLYWRNKLTPLITAAMGDRKLRAPIDVTSVADHCLATLEGGFILARTLKDPPLIVRQMKQFRSYLEALFMGAPNSA